MKNYTNKWREQNGIAQEVFETITLIVVPQFYLNTLVMISGLNLEFEIKLPAENYRNSSPRLRAYELKLLMLLCHYGVVVVVAALSLWLSW